MGQRSGKIFKEIEELWEIPILSSYGKQRKKQWSAYQPGEEEIWQKELQKQEEIGKMIEQNDEIESLLIEELAALPDLTTILQMWEIQQLGNIQDWFFLKRFVIGFMRIIRILKNNSFLSLLTKEEAFELEEIIATLQPKAPITSSFSLLDGFSANYETLWRRLQQSERSFHSLVEKRRRQMSILLGKKSNHLGEWSWSKQDNEIPKELLEELVLVRQTQWESIYRLRETKEEQIRRIECEKQRDGLEEEAQRVLFGLYQRCNPYRENLSKWGQRIGELDFSFAKWRKARSWQGVRPNYGQKLEIVEGRHPLIERELQKQGKRFYPISFSLGQETAILVGPNMGGKTVVLKTIATIAFLSQFGFFVPASRCSLPLFSWVELIQDDTTLSGLSSFGSEMSQLARVLVSPSFGFLLLDELARGTNPNEGAALSIAIAEYLVKHRFPAILTTHFPEVLEVSGASFYRMVSHSTPLEDGFSVLFQLTPMEKGEKLPQEAIQTARKLGLPEDILQNAERLLESRREE
ncbi:lysine 5,6-aminomutase reactivase ATPase KamC [Risungbinella massiliensis]|uniref:lysine 5,6-aminomutase reactivase ATPase KamC n=1 Tax=Risungbinella massiliensis TaxID=1329796 RepID=UPI0005CC271C|nr:hypothetical protein [Risungbinella massiliensis]